MCILSRWLLVFSIFLFPYARLEGKAKVFTGGVNVRIFILTTIITIVFASIIGGLKGILILIAASLFVYMIDKFIKNRIGGITGDTLGAATEAAEIVILAGVYSFM